MRFRAQGQGFGHLGMGKKCHNGIGINIFERWEVGFGKNMGWEI